MKSHMLSLHSIYCKVPRLLRSTHKISKFINPFEEVTFKKTRHQLKQVIDHYRRPIIKLFAQKLWSKKNWKCKLKAHKHRLFIEQQRTGLYFAMLRYKVYPKYHQFIEDFHGEAKRIQFFKFLSKRCLDRNFMLTRRDKSVASVRSMKINRN